MYTIKTYLLFLFPLSRIL